MEACSLGAPTWLGEVVALAARGTLLGVRHHLRTSGVAFPFVIERLRNTAARSHQPSPDLRARPI